VKSSALYDARQHATPSQLRALQERNDRKAWLELLAKQDKPVSCQSASERNAPCPTWQRKVLGGGRSYREVFERAARQHPIELRQPAQEQPAPWFFIVSEGYGPFVSIEQIQRAVVDQFKTVTRRDLMCKRREARIVHCRQIAFYVARRSRRNPFLKSAACSAASITPRSCIRSKGGAVDLDRSRLRAGRRRNHQQPRL
jgi:hypothetical protein